MWQGKEKWGDQLDSHGIATHIMTKLECIEVIFSFNHHPEFCVSYSGGPTGCATYATACSAAQLCKHIPVLIIGRLIKIS
jgi:hypothetical protein